MKKILSLAALSLPLVASAGTNLLSNGSFEDGLVGWTVSSGGGADPVSTITYGVAGPYGTVVPADDSGAFNPSPDAVGTMAAYFVDDVATQSVSQTITLDAGVYQYGFSLLAPSNGIANTFNSEFSITFAGVTDTFAVTPTLSPGDVWFVAAGESAALAAGSYTFTFGFTGGGVQANDVVIDRAFVMAVPEPETYALMLAGLCAVGFMARRRQA